MIPESFIQDLLARVDIVDLVDAYVPLKKAGACDIIEYPLNKVIP